MDAAIARDLAGTGFRRPISLTSRTTSDEAFGRWFGLCHTSAPFEFYASRKELRRMASRSGFFAVMVQYNTERELHIPVPVYTVPSQVNNTSFNSMASGKTARLCDTVNVVKPKVVLPFGHPARHFPSYNNLHLPDTPNPHDSTPHGSRRPTIAMDMSVLMCACRILIDDPLCIFPDYPFSHFLERRIGEYLHVANLLWSEYLVIWGLRNLCTDANVFRFLKLLQVIQLGTTTPWGHLQDILLHRNGKLSSYTIYGMAASEWHNGLPTDFRQCKELATRIL